MDAMALGGERELTSPWEVFTSEDMIDSLKNSFFLVDRFGCFIYACRLFAKMLGESPESIIGKNISELLPNEHLNRFDAWRDKLLSGQSVEFEWELPLDDENPGYIRISLNPLLKDEELVGAVGMVFDITKVVIGERELEKKALLLQLQMDVLESLCETGGITETLREIVDRACEALSMDSGCLASVYPSERGWLARQIINNRWPVIGPDVVQWKEVPGKSLHQLLDNKEIFSLEEGEGPVEWVAPLEAKLALVTPMAASPGGAFVLIMVSSEERQWHGFEREFLQGLVSIGGQALQRAEMSAALRQSEESYMNLAEGIVEAIAIIESETLIYTNQAMAKLMGFEDGSEMKGMSLKDFVTPESLQELRLRSHRRGLAPGKMRIHLRRPAGQELLTDVEITHLAYGHRRAYQVMIKGCLERDDEDDTDFEFMSRLSHDFRTPLVSVNGFADVLQRLVGDHEDAKVEECVQGIKRGVKRLNRMVDNMLTLARADAVSTGGWSNPTRIIQEVVEDLRQFIYEAGVDIVIQPDIPPISVGESDLQEIFQNLLSNAIRAVRGVANPRVAVGYESSGGNHVFNVQDNGVGIPQKYHETIFKPLFRLATGADGSGLGLSIARKILRAHGGDIWIKSASGVGTTFYFSIPT
ncbi:MAG: hypothetical protein A2V52_05665 [Actinobacteria bacterium RBG_19FT_COMBO_54_7]|uniref:Sensor-like histidine kinase SenX3 n=1 Tax=Candidatus Solincola sediminis TaxID=1797199 RepID=A0A1F2WFB6_9ACTN|nr:MAG: hypothetical protein A2Y75_09545 [Candidatus Solincola sediminis]OFW57771.1 MAG: hypothetical protein A2W01_04940 [Candidatus Solincola sediminis]OFW70360.1 MAG: hypothetical protein A2V52_05665 [Actinobacteria bacterium RBG_19FT_COMBO_54_7]